MSSETPAAPPAPAPTAPPPPPNTNAVPSDNRGGRGRGRGGAGGGGRTGGRHPGGEPPHGRVPMGGRGLVPTDGRGPHPTSNRGGPQHRPVSVHSGSGVPFGHVPAYLPGSSSLVEELDQRILIVLRDGKHLIGTLSSFDQFSNMVLSEAIERRIVTVKTDGNSKNYFADIPLGMYVVRGDSMVLCGEVHNHWPLLEEVSLEELEKLQEKAEPPLEWEFDLDLTA